jgi:hypothetical protein
MALIGAVLALLLLRRVHDRSDLCVLKTRC